MMRDGKYKPARKPIVHRKARASQSKENLDSCMKKCVRSGTLDGSVQ